jgi:hypothetical protein
MKNSLFSCLQKDSEELLQKWASADTVNRCPVGRHEYCADSERGRDQGRVTVASKQNKSNNRRANRAHQHNVGFEYPYDLETMQAESHQIADYARKTSKRNKYPKGFKK